MLFGSKTSLNYEIISEINPNLSEFATSQTWNTASKFSFLTVLVERNKSPSNDDHKNKVLLVFIMFYKSCKVQVIKSSVLVGGSILLQMTVEHSSVAL